MAEIHNRELGMGADHWNVAEVDSGESTVVRMELSRAIEHLF